MYIWHITFRYHENHFENMIFQSEIKDKIVLKTEYPTLKNLLFELRPYRPKNISPASRNNYLENETFVSVNVEFW